MKKTHHDVPVAKGLSSPNGKKTDKITNSDLLNINDGLMAISKGGGNILVAVQVGYLKRLLSPLVEPVQEEMQKLIDKHSAKKNGHFVEPKPNQRRIENVDKFIKTQEKLMLGPVDLPKIKKPLQFDDIEQMDNVKVTEFQISSMKKCGILVGVPDDLEDVKDKPPTIPEEN